MRNFLLILMLAFSWSIHADNEQDELYPLTTSTTTIGIGSAQLLDPYLTPFTYNGTKLRLRTTSRRFFKPENNKFSYTHKGYFDLGNALHPSRNNSMLFFDVNYLFGFNYHIRPAENWMVLLGGNWDLNVGGKYLSRNVNNPFSLDLSTNINAAAEVQYIFNLWKQDFSVQYGAQTPLLGYMFVPMQGITYYEMFVLSNVNTAFHFSSLHNRRAWLHYLNIDIPTKVSTFRVSLMHDYLKYGANDLVFKKAGVTFSLGAVVDLYVFSGKKKKIPANFIRSYE